jgi:hypothetical protein
MVMPLVNLVKNPHAHPVRVELVSLFDAIRRQPPGSWTGRVVVTSTTRRTGSTRTRRYCTYCWAESRPAEATPHDDKPSETSSLLRV